MDVNSSGLPVSVGKSAAVEKSAIYVEDGRQQNQGQQQQQEITTRTLATVRWTAAKTATIGTSQM
jgi:hypothetical protein